MASSKFRAPYSSHETPQQVARHLSRKNANFGIADDLSSRKSDYARAVTQARGKWSPDAATVKAERDGGIGDYSSTATVYRSGKAPKRTGRR